jgi:beta-galactosidase
VKRRDFLKTTGALIAGAALPTNSFADRLDKSGDSFAVDRIILPLNRHWRFNRTFPEGAELKAFDDSVWERVVVPHSNASLPWHSFDEKSYQFVSCYRRRFTLPPAARGRRVFVDFEGVMTASIVWLNGALTDPAQMVCNIFKSFSV